jgi:hypothetical protein
MPKGMEEARVATSQMILSVLMGKYWRCMFELPAEESYPSLPEGARWSLLHSTRTHHQLYPSQPRVPPLSLLVVS